jgi:hypothetical protein
MQPRSGNGRDAPRANAVCAPAQTPASFPARRRMQGAAPARACSAPQRPSCLRACPLPSYLCITSGSAQARQGVAAPDGVLSLSAAGPAWPALRRWQLLSAPRPRRRLPQRTPTPAEAAASGAPPKPRQTVLLDHRRLLLSAPRRAALTTRATAHPAASQALSVCPTPHASRRRPSAPPRRAHHRAAGLHQERAGSQSRGYTLQDGCNTLTEPLPALAALSRRARAACL